LFHKDSWAILTSGTRPAARDLTRAEKLSLAASILAGIMVWSGIVSLGLLAILRVIDDTLTRIAGF